MENPLINGENNTSGSFFSSIDTNTIISILFVVGGIMLFLLIIYFVIYLYLKFYYLNNKEKYIKIGVLPNSAKMESEKGFVYKFMSFIMNSYTMPELFKKNKIMLELEGGEVFNRFNVYVPEVYLEDYIRILGSHYPEAVFIYNKNDLIGNVIEDDYNYNCFRHSNIFPLGKQIQEVDIKQNIGAIINSIKPGEKLQMNLNFSGVLDTIGNREQLTIEAEDIKVGNISGQTNVYKKIFSSIRYLTKESPNAVSIGGLVGYIFEKKGQMISTRVKSKEMKKSKTYYNGFKEKVWSHLYNIGSNGKQYIGDFCKSDGFFLTELEIAGIFNFVEGGKLEVVDYQKLDPKNAYNKVKIEAENKVSGVKMGEFDYPGYEGKDFVLSDISKRKHCYVIGKTGMGKSTVLSNLMKDDIQKGKGFVLFDPNGDLAQDIMELVPESRKDDVVFISPSSPLGNVSLGIFDFLRDIRNSNLEGATKIIEDKGHGILTNNIEVLAANLTAIIRSSSIGGSDMWGPRMDMLLKIGIKAVLGSSDKATIADLITFYNDNDFRKAILRRVTNPFEKAQWEKIEKMKPEEIDIWYQPIRNRLMNYATEVFLGLFSTKPKFNLNEYINSDKILIFDLAKGPTGAEIGKFTGTVMFALIWEFIQLRAKIPKNERRDFSVYIDEFQNYVSETFPFVLSEARKYALSLVIAHQYLDQIQVSGVLPAVLGNCGTVIALQIGVEDGKRLSNFFGLEPNDLASIPPFKAYVKANDYSTKSFNIKTFPIEKEKDIDYVELDDLILHSYKRFGTKKEDLGDNIGLYSYFIKNKRLPDEIMNTKEDLDLELQNIDGFSVDHVGTDVEINENHKLLTYKITREDINEGKTFMDISKYMGFNNYEIFEVNIQNFNIAFKTPRNKIPKNLIDTSITVYYGGL